MARHVAARAGSNCTHNICKKNEGRRHKQTLVCTNIFTRDKQHHHLSRQHRRAFAAPHRAASHNPPCISRPTQIQGLEEPPCTAESALPRFRCSCSGPLVSRNLFRSLKSRTNPFRTALPDLEGGIPPSWPALPRARGFCRCTVTLYATDLTRMSDLSFLL